MLALAMTLAVMHPIAGYAVLPAKIVSNSNSAALRAPDLQGRLEALARRASPGTLGIAVLDLRSGNEWRVNAQEAFPMMSVFKAPVAATVLSRIDHDEISMDQIVAVERGDLDSGTIREHFHGERMNFTVRQLLTDAVSHSDNTAVDALLKLVGGAGVVTAFLRAHGIEGMRVDLGESGFRPIFGDLKPDQQPPAHESAAQELARLRRGYKAYLADPRNRTTPDAAASFLQKLWDKQLVSPSSTRYLINLMYAQTTPRRLRAGIPQSVRLADKCGTSYTLEGMTAAFNDIGMLTWPHGHVVIVAAFLTSSPASLDKRNAIFADLAREVTTALHP